MAAHRPKRVYPGTVSMIEQPASDGLGKFRYQSETGSGRRAGCLLGVNTTNDNKSFPKIRIQVQDPNYAEKELLLIVSCVTTEQPYLVHPNKLTGNGCENGVFRTNVSIGTSAIIELRYMGIVRVRKGDVKSWLEERERINVDPYKNGFCHKSNNRTTISSKAVRLCCQVFYWETENGTKKLRTFCEPVVSNIIYSKNKNTVPDLAITRISDCISDADGNGKEIILWCGDVKKGDIEVKFVKENENGEVVWEARATKIEVQKKNSSIAFQAPPYQMSDGEDMVNVKLKLYRPSDGSEGEARDFLYLSTRSVCTCRYYREFYKGFENNLLQIPKDNSPKTMNYDRKRARFDRDLSEMTKTLPTLNEYSQIKQSTILSMDWNGSFSETAEQNIFKSEPHLTDAKRLDDYTQPTTSFYQQQADPPSYPLNIINSFYQPPIVTQPPNEQANPSPIVEHNIFDNNGMLFNSDEFRKLAIDTMDMMPENFLTFDTLTECDFQTMQVPTAQQNHVQQFPSNNFCQEAYRASKENFFHMDGTMKK